jgi:hypothetical protein
MSQRLEVVSGELELVGVRNQSNYTIMLARLAGTHPSASLKVLADVVEPVKAYAREAARGYTSLTP